MTINYENIHQAIAAIRSNRHYIGFELSEEYHKTCIKRIKREAQEQTLF